MTTSIQASNLLSSFLIVSFPMSVLPIILPTSHPSYNSVPFTYLNPTTMLPRVSLVVPSILANLYTLPSVSNVPMPHVPSNDSTILSLSQSVSSLQQQLASFTQSKFKVPTCDMGSPLSFDIIYIVASQQNDMPHLDTYNGKGDLVTHLKTFQVLCSDYAYDHRILAKLFVHTFHDKYLQ